MIWRRVACSCVRVPRVLAETPQSAADTRRRFWFKPEPSQPRNRLPWDEVVAAHRGDYIGRCKPVECVKRLRGKERRNAIMQDRTPYSHTLKTGPRTLTPYSRTRAPQVSDRPFGFGWLRFWSITISVQVKVSWQDKSIWLSRRLQQHFLFLYSP